MVLHKLSPGLCTEKAWSGIADVFLAAMTLALARAYEHAQPRILTLLQPALSSPMGGRWQACPGRQTVQICAACAVASPRQRVQNI